MIIEALQWAGLESVIKTPTITKITSNIILFLYVMSYILNRKGCLIAAFISCELWCYSGLSDWVANEFFYIGYAVVYCLVYFYIKERTKCNVHQLSSLVLMILLEMGMALDAYFYPKVTTDFWRSYEFNVLLLHGYIIASFINWRLLRVHMGESARAILHILGVNDAARFCWYNLTKQAKL